MRGSRARPAFVVTFSLASVGGCAKDAPMEHTHNPPATPDPPVSAVETAPVIASAVPPRDDTPIRNPTVQGSHVRLAADGTCFVYQPFGPLAPGEQRPPGTEPPRAAVLCPAGFAADPAYKDCIAGVVVASAGGASCECAVGGNPPPPPRAVACPKP